MKKNIFVIKVASGILMALFLLSNTTLAGSLTPSAVPAATSYTLYDIMQKLTTNNSAKAGAHDFGATTTPRSTFSTLTDLWNAIPTINPVKLLSDTTYLGITGTYDITNLSDSLIKSGTKYGVSKGSTGSLLPSGGTATAGDVVAGKTFFGDSQSDWNTQMGTIPAKSGDASAVASTISTNKLSLTPATGYYDGTTATISTTSTAFDPVNIKSGVNLFGLVGTLAAGWAYGSNDASLVLTSADSAGTYDITNLSDSLIKSGTKYGVSKGSTGSLLPSGGTATAGDVVAGKTFFGDSQSDWNTQMGTFDPYTPQKLQTKDDWVNSGGTVGEYTAEESIWVAVSGSPFAGYGSINYAGTGGDLDLISGTVKQDTRTGLWWSDIMAVGASASTTTNFFSLIADGSRPTGGNAIGFCDALNTANFGGHADWYLPTQKQFLQAYIDGAANNLPNPGYYFWSSTEAYNGTASAWPVALNGGYTNYVSKSNYNSVRCVRP